MLRRRGSVWLAVGLAVVALATTVGIVLAAAGSSGPGSTRVASACAAPRLRGTVVGVTLVDMGGGMGGSMMGGGSPRGMMRLAVSPSAVRPGLVSFGAVNVGRRAHELVVLPLAPGRQAGERQIGSDNRVTETGSLGEASRTCGAGAGQGIEPGASGWVTIALKPGRYERCATCPVTTGRECTVS